MIFDMKELKMVMSLILRVLIVVIGWGSFMYLIYGFGSGTIPLWDRGVAVDSEGNLYIGSAVYIQVYSPTGEPLQKIYAQTDAGYCFTIAHDELFINQGERVVVLDLNGNILRNEEVDNLFWYSISPNSYTTEEGTKYKIGIHAARKTIMQDTVDGWIPILKMPMECLSTLLICFSFISFAALSVLSIIYQFKKNLF